MKKAAVFLFAVFVCGLPLAVSADTGQFTTSLRYGMEGSADVQSLQEFLAGQGFFAGEATGNYFSLTRTAVMNFQQSVGIDPTGFFGPLTLTAANILRGAVAGAADISSLSVNETSNSQTAAVLNSANLYKILTWKTSNYPAGVGIDIHLIRKISKSPVQFEFVREVATGVPNIGVFYWVPNPGDLRGELYIEIACLSSYRFKSGCDAGVIPLEGY